LSSGKDRYSESRSTPQQEKYKEENTTRKLQLHLIHERECFRLELEEKTRKEVLVHDTEMKKLHFAALTMYNEKKDPEPVFSFATLVPKIGVRIWRIIANVYTWWKKDGEGKDLPPPS